MASESSRRIRPLSFLWTRQDGYGDYWSHMYFCDEGQAMKVCICKVGRTYMLTPADYPHGDKDIGPYKTLREAIIAAETVIMLGAYPFKEG